MVPSKTPLQVVIVGGVASGMSAATRLRRLDERAIITVFEMGPYVSYTSCGLPYSLGGVVEDDNGLILQNPETFKQCFNIDVYINTKVVDIDRVGRFVTAQPLGEGEGSSIFYYDKLILAQGAEPLRTLIRGIDLPHVFTFQTVPDLQAIREFQCKHNVRHVAIIGGGYIGLETAEALNNVDREVTIIEDMPQVFPPIDEDMAESLHAEIRRHDVRLLLDKSITRIEAGRVVLPDGSIVGADMVILAVEMRARLGLAREAGLQVGKTGVVVNSFMQTSDPNIYAVGDMTETHHRIAERPLQLPLAGPANRQGRLAADHIHGEPMQYRGNVGTFVCKVFHLTVACTGLPVKTLRKMGHDPLWITVHPADHASYYPGAHVMTLRIIFERKTGRLLGAQAIGTHGVDKRIDVLSTALQAGMSIFDLENLELSYAPPYASAKDPVNMAGFVGGNVLRGHVHVIHAEDFEKERIAGAKVVDVRSREEFGHGHVRDAVNLPLNALRGSLTVLDKSRRVVVYCGVGYRGYLAYRILKQEGFDVVNLDGGYKTLINGGYKI